MTTAPADSHDYLLAADRARRTAARLGQVKRWHPTDPNLPSIEQDTLAARIEVAVRRLRDEYPGAVLRTEQVEYLKSVMSADPAEQVVA